MHQSLIFASILFVGLSKLLGTDVSKSPDSLWEIQHILNKNVLEKRKWYPESKQVHQAMHLMKLLNFDCAKQGFSRKKHTEDDNSVICHNCMYIAVFREQWIILISPTSFVEKEILFNYI